MRPCYGSDLGDLYCTKNDQYLLVTFLGGFVWCFLFVLFKGLEMQLRAFHSQEETAEKLGRPTQN